MERRSSQLGRQAEFVQLSVAAMVACRHLAESRFPAQPHANGAELVGLAAIALSQATQIHARQADGRVRVLTRREVEERLFCPMRAGRPPDLDQFLIRRSDLSAAIRALSDAMRRAP
jgi:hypothetical protein